MRIPLLLPVLATVLGLAGAARADETSVRVLVSKSAAGSAVVYRYRIINQDPRGVVSLRVGYDYFHGVSELVQPPSGWTFAGGLPAAAATTPSGWTARVITVEESPYVSVQWSNDGSASADVPEGGTDAAFSVTVPQEATSYELGHFDVILANSTHVAAPLEADDAIVTPVEPDKLTPEVKTGCGACAAVGKGGEGSGGGAATASLLLALALWRARARRR